MIQMFFSENMSCLYFNTQSDAIRTYILIQWWWWCIAYVQFACVHFRVHTYFGRLIWRHCSASKSEDRRYTKSKNKNMLSHTERHMICIYRLRMIIKIRVRTQIKLCTAQKVGGAAGMRAASVNHLRPNLMSSALMRCVAVRDLLWCRQYL